MLTAHPTQVNRRTLQHKHTKIAALLQINDRCAGVARVPSQMGAVLHWRLHTAGACFLLPCLWCQDM